jgi:hypothetical protein
MHKYRGQIQLRELDSIYKIKKTGLSFLRPGSRFIRIKQAHQKIDYQSLKTGILKFMIPPWNLITSSG